MPNRLLKTLRQIVEAGALSCDKSRSPGDLRIPSHTLRRLQPGTALADHKRIRWHVLRLRTQLQLEAIAEQALQKLPVVHLQLIAGHRLRALCCRGVRLRFNVETLVGPPDNWSSFRS